MSELETKPLPAEPHWTKYALLILVTVAVLLIVLLFIYLGYQQSIRTSSIQHNQILNHAASVRQFKEIHKLLDLLTEQRRIGAANLNTICAQLHIKGCVLK